MKTVASWLVVLVAAISIGACSSSGAEEAPIVTTEDTSGSTGTDAALPDVVGADTSSGVDTVSGTDTSGGSTGGDGDTDTSVDTNEPPECESPSQCKDFDNCTEDLCVNGSCENPAIPGCCAGDEDCDDGIDCTTDKCNFAVQQCTHTPQDNACCLEASDCDDFNACTLDACVANQCIHPTNSSAPECACVVSVLCDDGNACTEDKCVAGVCTYDPVSGSELCCGGDADCDDGKPETQDACLAGLCWNGASACEAPSDCPTVSPCFEPACSDGMCAWNESPGCCFTNSDCDDGEALTTDRCIQGSCVFTLGQPVACTDDAQCEMGSPCVTGTCEPTAKFCTVAATGMEGCCASADDCPAVPSGCGQAVCDAFACQVDSTDVLVPYWSEDFNAPTLAWTVESDATTAKWQLATAQFISPGQSLYYGALPQKTIDVGTTEGTALSPLITPNLGEAVMLSFQRNAAIEAITSVDKFWLEVVDEATGTGVEVWNKNYNLGPGLGWKPVLLDISEFVSGPFRLRFAFDSVDSVAGPLNEGVYVDDVRIGTPCQ